MKTTKLAIACAPMALALALPGAASAAVWVEAGAGGAGDSVATAQATYDSSYNPLTGITGFLTATTPVNANPIYQVDLYKIRIDDPGAFSARTMAPVTDFDSALFLFDASGMGVYMNDDNGVDLLSTLPAGDAAGPVAAGIYYLAVALGGFSAFDVSDLSIFMPGGFGAVAAADPAAGALHHWLPGFDAWTESPQSYFIALSGATNSDIPEPGSLALLLAAGVAGWLVRRPQVPRAAA